MKVFCVYVLISSKDGRFYVGYCSDLKRRLGEHNLGKVKSTKHRRPLKLICFEVYSSKEIAQRRERYLKSSDGKKDIRRRFQ